MDNIVISSKFIQAFAVKYPYGSHIDFFATSAKALSDGLKKVKWSYAPEVFEMELWHKTPKFKKLTKKQIESITINY